MSMKRKFWFGFMVAVLASAMALGSDLAILRNGFSIRHERREVIDSTTRLYLSGEAGSYVDVPTTEIERFEKDLTPRAVIVSPRSQFEKDLTPRAVIVSPRSQNVNDFVNSASDRQRLDPDLVNSVIRAESGFNPRAVSPKGALGLMQLMPQTALELGVPNAFDPQANVEGGTRYLRELLERYNFDLIKALAAYNAGSRRVEQYRGVPPYFETRAYVARIIRDFNRKKLSEQANTQANIQKANIQKSGGTQRSTPHRQGPVPSRPTAPAPTQQSE
jgi:soluble lytic murein transglycosylase-like protein